MPRLVPILSMLLMLTPSLNAATDPLAALLDGVKSIGTTGSPGPVVVFGDHAWPLLVGNADKSAAPVAACATLDRGRIVILGHNGYVLDPASVEGDAARLLENAARWVASIDKPLGVVRAPKLATMLRQRKLDVVELDPRDIANRLDNVSALLGNVDLAAIPRERERPERYVTDVQISAGYMHSGYPIMTHLDAAPRFVDLATLRGKGDWGMFHEIGHNHQSGDWTFAGTGEVTVNLFTMYILETVCRTETRHGAITPEAMRKHIERFEKENRSFDLWKREPFLALVMYRQMIDAFGWEPMKRVFAEYRALPADRRPKNDDEKRHQWLVRMSRATGRNLGPFFESWSVPTSESARQQVSGLPVWMPDK